jgi:hypothetical protein
VRPPRAAVVHRIDGRLRLRIPEKRDDVAFFEELAGALSKLPDVEQVITNATTTSVLIHHRGSGDALLRASEQGGLLELDAESPSGTPIRHLYERIEDADQSLREKSAGRWDLPTLAFYALVGGSLVQLARGHFMPAGATLAVQALGLVMKQGNRS